MPNLMPLSIYTAACFGFHLEIKTIF